MEDESTLIQAAKANKRDFVALYDLHFDAIYAYLLSRVASVPLAEDLCSETFSLALSKIDSYKITEKPFSAWLYRIAINQMNQHFRRKKVEEKYLAGSWEEVNSSFEADESIKNEEELEKLKLLNLLFRDLPSKDQDLLSLRYFNELSYKDIADALGISVNNVGVKINRAISKLENLCNAPTL